MVWKPSFQKRYPDHVGPPSRQLLPAEKQVVETMSAAGEAFADAEELGGEDDELGRRLEMRLAAL